MKVFSAAAAAAAATKQLLLLLHLFRQKKKKIVRRDQQTNEKVKRFLSKRSTVRKKKNLFCSGRRIDRRGLELRPSSRRLEDGHRSGDRSVRLLQVLQPSPVRGTVPRPAVVQGQALVAQIFIVLREYELFKWPLIPSFSYDVNIGFELRSLGPEMPALTTKS